MDCYMNQRRPDMRRPGCSAPCNNGRRPSCGCQADQGNCPAAMPCHGACGNVSPKEAAYELERTRNDMPGFQLAMAYVPWQCWGDQYCCDEALQRGTIFPALDFPFLIGRCAVRR